MQILAIVGSLGAGKSDLAETTIGQAVRTGMLALNRAAYLLNDRPSPDGRMVDGDSVRDVARVIPFPNRCFTCEDSGNLVRQLRELSESGGVDVVIIEGYGFVAGAETREALTMMGYPFQIFSLVDAQHLAQNRAAYGEIIESHISSATLGIGITHTAKGGFDATLDFVNEHVQAGIPVMEIKKGHGIPPRLLSRLLDGTREPLRGCSCGHDHAGHGHEHHHHDHGHAQHDFFSVTYPLRAGVTVEELQGVLQGSPVFRGKGIASGIRFDFLHGSWSKGNISGQPGIVTLYSREEEVRIPERLIDDEVRGELRGSTKSLLRQDVEPEAATAALERLMSEIPSDPVVMRGSAGLRVAVQLEELQLLKQVAQRPNVKADWLLKAVSTAIRYWIACAHYIKKHEAAIDSAELPISLLEAGLSLGWWANRFERELAPDLLHDVAETDIENMLAHGMHLLAGDPRSESWLLSNPDRAADQASYYLDAMMFAARHSRGHRPEINVLGVGLSIARKGKHAKVISAWDSALRRFTEHFPNASAQ